MYPIPKNLDAYAHFSTWKALEILKLRKLEDDIYHTIEKKIILKFKAFEFLV